MKGQSSLELMVTVGVVIAFTIPVLFLLLSVSSVGYEDTAKAQADASARTLADTMNSVYAQGPGAERELLLNVPATTQEVRADAVAPGQRGGEAIVRIRTSGGGFDATSPTIAVVSPSSQTIVKKTGLFRLVVRADPQGRVELIDPTAP
ncbi:MAG: hypothetical protein U0R44_07060 [Candidatus Micrarchaeia archaeon]